MKRIVNALGKVNRRTRAYSVVALVAATAVGLPAQTFTTLHSFDGADAANAYAALAQATNRDLYGTTETGGANSSVWTQNAELTAPDGTAGGYFGYSVALSGNTAVVGAQGDGPPVLGSAYVFVRSGSGWSLQQELTASDGVQGDIFGVSVAVSGDTVVVGAKYKTIGSNPYQGAAYVFVRSGTAWSQQQELTSSDGATPDNFGNSVAVSGDTVVVGAYNKTIGSNPGQGAAYVFVRSGTVWSQQQELTSSDGAANDLFGSSVSLDGDSTLVGAACQEGCNLVQGAAYVFVRNGTAWSQQQELTSSDGAAFDNFGASVSLDGDTALVGAVRKTIGANPSQGAAYVFVNSGTTWSQQQELTASDGAANDYFGLSVSVSGNTAVVGAPSAPLDGNPGAAYVFVRSGAAWTQQQELTASDEAANDQFGSFVALDGHTAVVGADFKMIGSNPYQGAAYVFAQPIAPVTLSTGTLNFGPVAVGNTSLAKTVTLANHENVTLNFSSILASTGFAVASNTCAASVAAGTACTVGVTFSPTATGAATGTLTFSDDATNSPQVVVLAGTGRTPVTLSTSTLNLGTVAVGNTSAAKTVTLANHQNVALDFSSILTSTGFAVASNTCGASVGPGTACTVGVTFSPTATGAAAGTLTFSDDATNSPQVVSLEGTGRTPVTLSTSTLNLGTVAVGNTSAAKTVTLANHQNVALDFSSILTSTGFAVTSNTCGASVGPATACTVGVTFSPTATGAAAGTLTFSDDATNSPQVVSLTGEGK
jgi:hypothetical protein